jgi:hypothetical protein
MTHLLIKSSVTDFLCLVNYRLFIVRSMYLSLQFQFQEGTKSHNVQNAQYPPRTQDPPVVNNVQSTAFLILHLDG